MGCTGRVTASVEFRAIRFLPFTTHLPGRPLDALLRQLCCPLGAHLVRFEQLFQFQRGLLGTLNQFLFIVACFALHMQSPVPVMLVEGSATVFINGQPAVRVGDKTMCGAKIKQGSSNVFIGGGTRSTSDIKDNEGLWQTGFEVVGMAALVGAGGMALAAGIGAVAIFGGVVGAGYSAFKGLGALGNAIGPGYADLLQGSAGVATLFAGPKLAKGSTGQSKKNITSDAKERSAYLSKKYGSLTSEQRMARIDELSRMNYERRIGEAINNQEYVFRYLSEESLGMSLRKGTVRGYTTTEFSYSSSAVAKGAQILPEWGVPQYGVAIPVDKFNGFSIARPMGNKAAAGWEVFTNSYPEAGAGGFSQFLIKDVPIDQTHIFRLKP